MCCLSFRSKNSTKRKTAYKQKTEKYPQSEIDNLLFTENHSPALRGSDISQAPHLTSLFWPRLNISFHGIFRNRNSYPRNVSK